MRREMEQHVDEGGGVEDLDPDYVEDIFASIVDELSPGDGKPGPKPVRAERVWSVFQGRVNEQIPLDDFESVFSESKTPRKSAASAISWFNNILKRWKFDIEIETIHTVEYRLKRRDKK